MQHPVLAEAARARRGGHQDGRGLRIESRAARHANHVADGDHAGRALPAQHQVLADLGRFLIGFGHHLGAHTEGLHGGPYRKGVITHVRDVDRPLYRSIIHRPPS